MSACAKDGCRANALKGEAHCFSHSMKPEVVQKRKAARSKGGSKGKLRVTGVTIKSIEDVKYVINETLNELRSSPTNDLVAKSRCIGYLCGIAINALEKADLEQRIAKLEESLSEPTS